MNPAGLRAIARAAFGRGWQRQLAAALGASIFTVRSWSCGRRRITATTEIAIRAVCRSAGAGKPS